MRMAIVFYRNDRAWRRGGPSACDGFAFAGAVMRIAPGTRDGGRNGRAGGAGKPHETGTKRKEMTRGKLALGRF